VGVAHYVHPEAEERVATGAADTADAVLFDDMPGYTFADGTVKTAAPSQGFKDAITRRFASGRGAVMMHHAIAGWAEWPQWSEWVGGRFLYQPGTVRGEARLDSGYRHDVDYTAELVAEHPVLEGIPPTFEVDDELYLGKVFEADVTPLIRARHALCGGELLLRRPCGCGPHVRQFGLAAPAGQQSRRVDQAGRRGRDRLLPVRRWASHICKPGCPPGHCQCPAWTAR
jgi:hypothetical protein